MDQSRFDHLARAVGTPQRRRTVTAALGVAVASLLHAPGSGAARHKRKKCAKRCKAGCCTSKYGKCIDPFDQVNKTPIRCGTGGQICRTTGCPECSKDRSCPPGQCCSGTGTCGACLVFVTSSTHTGNLNGWHGASAICDTRAASAGLPGRYLPWLSDGNISPDGALFPVVQSDTRFTLVDGTVVFNSRAELTSGSPRHAIDQTETGAAGSSDPDQVWTNVLPNGRPTDLFANSCAGWTSATGGFGNTGLATTTNQTWTTGTSAPCNASRRLYCFQIS